jgi:hypothetical protein
MRCLCACNVTFRNMGCVKRRWFQDAWVVDDHTSTDLSIETSMNHHGHV